MSNETQTVAEQDDPVVSQAGEQVGAQDESLDAMLAEYETAHKPQPTQQQAEPPNEDIKALAEYARNAMQVERQKEVQSSIEGAVKTVKEVGGINASDRIVRGLIKDMADENPAIQKAFANRQSDPNSWNRMLKGMAKELAKEFETDPSTSNDRQVVASAVRSASTAKPAPEEKVNFKGMNANQLADYLRNNGG